LTKNFTFRGKSGDNWKTPNDLYNKLNEEFNFTFDPCPLDENPLYDGLKLEWGLVTFVNPPYSNVMPWVKKAYEESLKGKTIVMLLKMDCSTRWFNEYVYPFVSEIRLINKRLHFNGLGSATFCSMVCIYNNNNNNKINPELKIMRV